MNQDLKGRKESQVVDTMTLATEQVLDLQARPALRAPKETLSLALLDIQDCLVLQDKVTMVIQDLQGLLDLRAQLCLWTAEAHKLLASLAPQDLLEHQVYLGTLRG